MRPWVRRENRMVITLACSMGMSTSLLVNKLIEAGKGKGLDLKVQAVPFDKMDIYADETDILLLGPQIRYLVSKFTIKYGSKIPVIAAIDMQDYALLRAENILNEVLNMYNK
jgi:PTS system cellobiose-specific IIB component